MRAEILSCRCRILTKWHWKKDEYVLTARKADQDLEAVYRFLKEKSYWGRVLTMERWKWTVSVDAEGNTVRLEVTGLAEVNALTLHIVNIGWKISQ